MNNQFCSCQADDTPKLLPPSKPPNLPSTFANPIQTGQMRSWMCNCLGRWGYLRLYIPGTFGRDLWFFQQKFGGMMYRDILGKMAIVLK